MKEDRLGNRARLQHILLAIREIQQYTAQTDFEAFEQNSMMYQACIRQLEIIGEASNRLTEDLRSQSPDVAWKQIIALRNLIAHQYFGVRLEVIWEVIQHDLPIFQHEIATILDNLN